MCTTDEVNIWLMNGGSLASANITATLPNAFWVAGDYGLTPGSSSNLCNGWTNGSSGDGAQAYAFDAGSQRPTYETCQNSRQILCCN
jgi:hypothetical protein